MPKVKNMPVTKVKVVFDCPETGKEVVLLDIPQPEPYMCEGERILLTRSCPQCGGQHEYI
jgi:predicted RNA-binding Zn-ribbon protein involved in translation (DUF1610 family)